MPSRIDDIKSVAVIGAGTMGQGIAQICAMAGYPTILYDIDKASLDKALEVIEKNLDKGLEKGKVTAEQRDQTLSGITLEYDLKNVKADFIIEAILENLELKHKLFKELENINGENSILASNTSSIPITKIASALQNPERFIGMHFFNPAHIMKLVEVISGTSTDKRVADLTIDFAKRLKKVAVSANDSPGFIVNRVARHFYVEALKVLEEKVTDVAGVDALMKATDFKMGPFELMDLIGVDTNLAVTTSMYEAFHQDSKFRPSRIQEQKVNAGHHGRKSGKGFYNYE